jgi:hypothetical protein
MGERSHPKIPPQEIGQPPASEPKNALVPPVVPVKAVSLAFVQEEHRQSGPSP